MDHDAVPQDVNRTLGGYRKAVYARDPQGRIVPVASTGWEVEEIVTQQAADALREQAEVARQAALTGKGSPLIYWMYARRMDLPLLAQTTGWWQWQVRRHLRQPVHALPTRVLQRYAQALALPVETLCHCPTKADHDV